MDYTIPSGDDFDPPAPGVKLSYCGVEPYLESNGTLYVSEIQQIGSDQLSVIGSFSVDNTSQWSGSSPLAVQVEYCGDDGNIYCVQYQINPVHCPADPLECNVWYVGSASGKDRDYYLGQYCVNLYNVNSNGCQSTEWTIDVDFEDLNGDTTQAYLETINIAGQGPVVTYCFDVDVPVMLDLNQVPYINFEITSLTAFPSNEIEDIFTINLPEEEYPDLRDGRFYFEGNVYDIKNSESGFFINIYKIDINKENSELTGVLEFVSGNEESRVELVLIDFRNDFGHRSLNHKIFPNPFSGELNIEADFTENTRIVVLDILGRKVNFEQREINQKQSALNLDAEEGLYFINIYENDMLIASEKVIKL